MNIRAAVLIILLASEVCSQCGPGQQFVQLSVYKKTEITVISTGGFKSNMTCSWNVTSKHQSAHILVQLKGVWLGADDFISIYDGYFENETAVLVYNFTKQSASSDLKDARSGKALVVFKSGNERGKGERGFTILLLAITTPKPKFDCKNETLTATNNGQVLTSPGFPEGYPANTTCFWTIKSPSTKYNLDLDFLLVDIEDGGTDCNYDYVKVYTKSKTSKKTTIFTKCEHNDWNNVPFNVSGKEVAVEFFSDVTDTRTGFLLRYSLVRKPKKVRMSLTNLKPDPIIQDNLRPVTPVPFQPTRLPMVPVVRDVITVLPPSLAPLHACGQCCTFSGTDCLQDCMLCKPTFWDVFANPETINSFYFNRK